MLCSYQPSECSFLEELTCNNDDVQNYGHFPRWGSYEQIVPGTSDSLCDVESSLYNPSSSVKSDISTGSWPCVTMSSAHLPETSLLPSSTLPPSYDDHVRSLHEEELRLQTSSPAHSDVSLAELDTNITDIVGGNDNENSDLLTDIMECIENVSKTEERPTTKKGKENGIYMNEEDLNAYLYL